jgi:signal transduction histidine kinase
MEQGALPDRRGAAIPALTAGSYFVVGALWIWFSDEAALALARSANELALLEEAKGWLFIVATAAILYFWLCCHGRVADEAQRELERRIEERTAELVAANKALESFTYSVAHDLRAPVAHVDGFAKALVDTLHCSDPACARARHFTERIAVNARQMSEMIEGMLHVSRAERAPVQRERIDMTRFVRLVAADVAQGLDDTLEIGRLPYAHADPRLLRQVWANLLSNAVKYSAASDAPRVRVSGSDGGGEIVYCVEDNGVGFDPVEGERLFNAFQRLSNAQSFAGSGVGLAIVKRIVERHGGRVWASGEPGRGARFCFALPG